MKLLLSHPTGNHNVRQALQAFIEQGMLAEFCTTISWDPNSLISKFTPSRLKAQLTRRSYHESLKALTHTSSGREIGRLVCSAASLGWAIRHEVGPFSVDRVCQSLDRIAAHRIAGTSKVSAVYCYEDAAGLTFAAAKEKGIRRIYEHPVGYWRSVQRIFEEERERLPEFVPVIAGIKDSESKRARKDREIKNAELIVVPSQYSARTLLECPTLTAKVEVVSYGAPEVIVTEPSAAESEKLKVIFVGSVQQRKGVSYLIDACRLVSSAIEVTVLGGRVADCGPVDQWLKSSHWIPSAPHAKVLETIRQCDVLVLPSLSEGFGLVVLEAMSQGITVIVSENTGAGDVVQNGVNGYVVPIRSSEAIAERLEILLRDRHLLREMKSAAIKTAVNRSWTEYRGKLIEACQSIFGVKG